MDRRAFLRGSGVVLGVVPFVGWERAAAATYPDPDQLFWQGEFAAADQGYAAQLSGDPNDVHACAQRGYIALLGNRFVAAERFLRRAIELGDGPSVQRLAECFVRQDQHVRARPLLQDSDSPQAKALATQYAELDGKPWRVHGAQRTRVPLRSMDPLPSVTASVDGGEPRAFLIDTYATLDLTKAVADDIGLRAVATVSGIAGGKPVTIYLGVLDTFRIGGIELCNVPIQWTDTEHPALPDGSQPAGVIGTTLFYHLLATLDYAREALVLRRKTVPPRPGGLPLWLAGDHYPCTVGSLRDYGPRIVTLDTGGIAHGIDTTAEMAERAGIPVDYDHPIDQNGNTVYPITVERMSLGNADQAKNRWLSLRH